MKAHTQMIDDILKEICRVVSGKEQIVRKVLMAILAQGHILIEDIPGVGKTTMALSVSKVLALDYNRMQFTPDVLPTDVLGYHVYQKETGELEYRSGSVMCNLFLADEINRTTSKTQSALLEVMEEGRVTVDSITKEVPKPFTVIATQNPVGSAGTQMLPESQLDRFMVRLSMGYPDKQSEVDILRERHLGNPLDNIKEVVCKEELIYLIQQVDRIYVHDALYEYIVNLTECTRKHEMIALGVSPRGSLAIVRMAKAAAYMAGREYVSPDDIRVVFADVVLHRMVLEPKARVNHVTLKQLLSEFLSRVPAPVLVS